MRYRLLGHTGLRISELFLGTMNFGRGPGSSPTDEQRRIVDLYTEAGGNVIDTADVYGGGESERVLGELLAGRRDRFVVATKYSLTDDPEDANAAGNHRKNLTLSLEKSLRRLRTDYIDLYWVHIWDRHTPVEETMRALDDAARMGKVLYVGISDTPAWVVARANTLAEWRDWTAFAGLQVPYNLLNRDIERELLPMAEALRMTVATWGPLAGGVLSGKYTRPSDAGEKANADRQLGPQQHDVARAVIEVADEVGATPAQVAIAWTRARHRTVHPIVGASTPDQLAENLDAVDLELPEEAVSRLDDSSPFRLGFPGDFIAEATPHVFGNAANRLDIL